MTEPINESKVREQCPHCGSPRTLVENVDAHIRALSTPPAQAEVSTLPGEVAP